MINTLTIRRNKFIVKNTWLTSRKWLKKNIYSKTFVETETLVTDQRVNYSTCSVSNNIRIKNNNWISQSYC